MASSESKPSQRDQESIKKIEASVQRFKNWNEDIDFFNTFYPHLQVHSASVPNPDPGTDGPHARATFTFTVQGEHCNRLGNLHGGAAATLFDFCTTMPLALINRPGFWSMMGVSRGLSVKYLRPVPKGETVLVDCDVIHVGKRLCSLRGTIKRASDGLVMATCEHEKFNTDAPVASKV